MLPSILAGQLKQGIKDYIRTTFPMTNEPFAGSLDAMFDGNDAVFHQPYVSVKLPFRKASAKPDCFSGVELPFMPYVHQEKAYARLTGDNSRSTLIATGTGSGKTECFLNPVLEYCCHHREPGIKALIIYPMNALATDQASRIAKAIASSPKLHGITAGIYIGGGHGKGATLMSAPDKEKNILGIITDHETMINTPPDILLTNYKMLDYLLVRPRDAGLWRDNRPDTLKYIVVDEFHTFDGAQGTDLACLLRRLKSRLYTPVGYLCCVGTSATMGGKDGDEEIRQYAEEVFGESFEKDSLITEDRLSPDEFFDGATRTYASLPDADTVKSLGLLAAETDETAYLQKAVDGWFPECQFRFGGDDMPERVRLGQALREHGFFQDVLTLMQGDYWQNEAICAEMKTRYPQIDAWPSKDDGMNSLMALVSYARTEANGRYSPFLFVQVQLWMRELRRLLARVSGEHVNYMLAPDLNVRQQGNYLPVVNCRECGATGWAGLTDESQYVHVKSLQTFYNLYFQASDKITLLYPGRSEASSSDFRPAKLCPNCHKLTYSENPGEFCPDDHGKWIDVVVPARMTDTGSRSKKRQQFSCPFCGSKRGLAIMGMRSTTGVSATLSQIMASPFNDDKKVLAFSDSVQDAAYRAGFFNARTWRFGLRGAIQDYVKNGGAGKNLADFTRGFLAYWENRLTQEQFVSRFIGPNMLWMQAYRDLKQKRHWGNDKAARILWRDIEKRLSYEILLEYGVTSRIGRTLEKSNCSCLTFDESDIITIAEHVQESVVNELNVLHSLPLFAFERMVIGWLQILRYRGGFADETLRLFVEDNIKDNNKTYKPHFLIPAAGHWWMPGLQSGRNNPRLICVSGGKGKCPSAFDTCKSNYYARWIEYCIDDTDILQLSEDVPAEISAIILKQAEAAGVVQKFAGNVAISIYGLNEEKVYISDDVRQFRCNTCGLQYSFAGNLADYMDGVACNRRNCSGVLAEDGSAGLDYYGRLYNQGDLVRVNAFEHTGLLEREDREHLENNFKRSEKEQRQDWDPNVLSCTPTLELGIDIGDLSSVILCSVPPGQAQFLQRVGRAGRTDGNSFVLVVANTLPHDLYFYTDPLDMMQGNVATPHIFLKASAVLQRQFVAFCMDNWVKSGIDEKAIPKHLGQSLIHLHQGSGDVFPYNYLHYVKGKLSSLFRMFVSCFSGDLDDQSKDELRRFSMGEGMTESPLHEKVLQAFEEVEDEIKSLNNNIRVIEELIREIDAKPKDSSYEEERKELETERKALAKVKTNIKGKDTFNFLSDEGLLPNYAFPEEGITLKAILFRKKDDESNAGGKKKPTYENRLYEYQRAASSAISEFAPNNTFYAGGHQFTIDQVDIHSAQPERWRLCPNCAHAERETESMNKAACPNCGDPGWSDVGQVRDMLKVRMVYSNMDMGKSVIDDTSDSRTIKFYTKQLLVDVDEDHDIEEAYSMENDEFPFGYEFVRKASLREINFGEADIAKTDKMLVDGQEETRKGFKVCRYCGRIQDAFGKVKHAPYCRVNKNEALKDDAIIDCLFLYREFQTEILRLLIPETTAVGTKVKTESFTAAFMLGMKEYFGNVDHLRATVSEVPVRNADYRKRYLVIYDSVPGGTGYLKQLMLHDDALIHVFEKALHVLETCQCKDDPNKDGCYHCLYAYRQSHNIGEISRRTAIQLLKAILSGKDNIKKIKKLSDVPTNHLFDSELEQQFIHVLSSCFQQEDRQVEVKQDVVRDKQGYILKVTSTDETGEHTYSWEIEPQVPMHWEQNVSVQCKPDFVFWPNFDTSKDHNQHLPVAVFTDGFTYHKDLAADDTLKRGAICRSGNFRVWSLSYKDVEACTKTLDLFATDTLNAMKMPSGPMVYKKIIDSKKSGYLHLKPEQAMSLLVDYLSMPDAEDVFTKQASAYSMSLLDPRRKKKDDFSYWYKTFSAVQEETQFTDDVFSYGKVMLGWWHPSSTADPCMTCYSGLNPKSFRVEAGKKVYFPAVASVLDDSDISMDIYQQEWNGFWHFYNVMQFAPFFTGVSKSGLENQVYTAWQEVVQPDDAPEDDDESRKWQAVLTDFEEMGAEKSELDFLHKLSQAGIPAPNLVMSDIADGDTVIDTVELGWSDRKIAFILQESDDVRQNIEKYGWTVFDETIDDQEIAAVFGSDRE